MLTANNVYQSESFPILSSFKDWIPRPWVRLLKDAGFRRRSPAANYKYRPKPQSKHRSVQYRTTRKPIKTLPRTMYPITDHKAMMGQPCTCGPRTRYSARTTIMETPIAPKTQSMKVKWPSTSSESSLSEIQAEDNRGSDSEDGNFQDDYDEGEDNDEEEEEGKWTDADLEFMCRRLADSKQKKGTDGSDWSTRRLPPKNSMGKSTHRTRYEKKERDSAGLLKSAVKTTKFVEQTTDMPFTSLRK